MPWPDLAARIGARVARLCGGREFPPGHGIEDLQQEVLLYAFRNLAAFDLRSVQQFWEWVRQVADHKWRDLWRRSRAQKRGGGRRRLRPEALDEAGTGLDGLPGPAGLQSAVARARELEERFRAAIAGLLPPHQEVLLLRILQGLSFAEIAERMGYEREGSVRVLFHRALVAFRRLGFDY